ncbi:MAG: NAD(P)/FAD-dependent oxidoreductase [Polyangiaceae bacterium]|nr:NAD(P)/FAD-dependent oxidoreductase [Polyangiaceae bacterium]
MTDFDVCVLGAGPAGFATAMRAWDFGLSVCLVERGRLGGAGLHDGALSSKTLWELSRDYRRALATDRGYRATNVELDYDAVCRCVSDAVASKTEQLQRQLDELGRCESDDGGRVTLVEGEARFLDPQRVAVSKGGETREISARNFVIATGSRPRELPDVVVDGERILTSDHIMHLGRFPKSLVIVGAGVVGCEFATVFANFGRTKVYLIDRAERILPFEDDDVARVCARNLEARGVVVHRRARLVSMRRQGDGVEYVIEYPTGGRETLTVECALISIGRVPNLESLGLEQAGVVLDERQHIADTDTRTSAPHIYAVGDVTLDVALVNVGEIEGRHVAEKIAGVARGSLSYENLSTIMFLDPEVAAIGHNEQSAQRERIAYRVAVYAYDLVNRAIAMRATDGFIKLLVTDDDEMRILGMRALGAHASTTLEAVSLMMNLGRSVRDLAELLHPHPAMTEALQDCARMLVGTSICKPHVFTSELRLARVGYSMLPPAPQD